MDRQLRDIIQEALHAAHVSGTLSPEASRWLLDRLHQQRYRIVRVKRLRKVKTNG